jgi:hypothetical protein
LKQTIGAIGMSPSELLPRVEAYVDARTLQIGLPLAGSLICWLVCHSVVVYCVFGSCPPGPLRGVRPTAILADDLGPDESDPSPQT